MSPVKREENRDYITQIYRLMVGASFSLRYFRRLKACGYQVCEIVYFGEIINDISTRYYTDITGEFDLDQR